MSDDKKVIFSMSGVTKTFKNANTPVLKDIYLSFFYGAKIGILGLNGSGKSTLLRIIAGEDKNYQGDVVFLRVIMWVTWNRNLNLTKKKRYWRL